MSQSQAGRIWRSSFVCINWNIQMHNTSNFIPRQKNYRITSAIFYDVWRRRPIWYNWKKQVTGYHTIIYVSAIRIKSRQNLSNKSNNINYLITTANCITISHWHWNILCISRSLTILLLLSLKMISSCKISNILSANSSFFFSYRTYI